MDDNDLPGFSGFFVPESCPFAQELTTTQRPIIFLSPLGTENLSLCTPIANDPPSFSRFLAFSAVTAKEISIALAFVCRKLSLCVVRTCSKIAHDRHVSLAFSDRKLAFCAVTSKDLSRFCRFTYCTESCSSVQAFGNGLSRTFRFTAPKVVLLFPHTNCHIITICRAFLASRHRKLSFPRNT